MKSKLFRLSFRKFSRLLSFSKENLAYFNMPLLVHNQKKSTHLSKDKTKHKHQFIQSKGKKLINLSVQIENCLQRLYKIDSIDLKVLEELISLYRKEADHFLSIEEYTKMKATLINLKYMTMHQETEDFHKEIFLIDIKILLAIWKWDFEHRQFLLSNFFVIYEDYVGQNKQNYLFGFMDALLYFQKLDMESSNSILHDKELSSKFLGQFDLLKEEASMSLVKKQIYSNHSWWNRCLWKVSIIDIVNNCSMAHLLLLKNSNHDIEKIIDASKDQKSIKISPDESLSIIKSKVKKILDRKQYLFLLFENLSLIVFPLHIDSSKILTDPKYLNSLDKNIQDQLLQNKDALKVLQNIGFLLSGSFDYSTNFFYLIDFLEKSPKINDFKKFLMFLEIKHVLLTNQADSKTVSNMIKFLLKNPFSGDSIGVLILLRDLLFEFKLSFEDHLKKILDLIFEGQVHCSSTDNLFFIFSDQIRFIE